MPIRNKLRYSAITLLVLLLVAAGYYLVKSPLLHKSSFVDSPVLFTGAKIDSLGAMSIYVLGTDGKVSELPSAPFTAPINATFSPDLTKIAFAASSGNQQIIAVMNADGSGVHQVSKLDGNKSMPSWSADGKKILYSLSKQGGGVSQIDLGSGTDKIVSVGTDLAQTPTWMPDGSGFVFMALEVDQQAGRVHSHLEVYKGSVSREIKVSGDNAVPLSDLGMPAVSPNGGRVAFMRTSDSKLYVANIDGRSLMLVPTSGNSLFSCPSWTPDASYLLAAESTNDGKYYLSKVNVTDGTVTRSSVSGFIKINCPRMARY